MQRERILITVKTYPVLSKKYIETVCTAGVREDGSWIRLYPIPFRLLAEEKRYSKYDWIECDVERHSNDPRPESYRPINCEQLRKVGHLGTKDNWHARRHLLLQKVKVYTSLSELTRAAKANEMSLAVFKPTHVLNFRVEAHEERDWDAAKLAAINDKLAQPDLFENNEWRETFTSVNKLPYAFSYRVKDSEGHVSTMRVLDWELGALYWNCLNNSGGDEKAALAKVRQKYQDAFAGTDLHFFLGTTLRFHAVAPNPWTIVGVFPVPHEHQTELNL